MLFQLITELWMCNVYQLPAAVADCSAMEIGYTILGDHIVNITP